MHAQPISASMASINPGVFAPPGAMQPRGFLAVPAPKTKPLTEQLGYANDAALIAELREVLALSAAAKMAPPASGRAATRHRSAE